MELAADVQALLKPLVDQLVAQGAHAVWLAGSHARGEARPLSDVDVGVIAAAGAGPDYRLERRDGHLVSVSWTTAEATRASFRDPGMAGAAVPGWRGALLLHDPDGIAAALRDEARAWRWEEIAGECERWLPRQFTGYTEEAQKLLAALEGGDRSNAAVQRSVLALRMAGIASVHLRLLYDTENRQWALVAEALGEPWAGTQAAALGLGGEPFEATCHAALRLFALTAEMLRPLLDERERAVVDPVLALIAQARGS